jgi:uncharacterized protein YqeY
MENRIQTDIMAAMKAKDEVALTTLRGIKTAIMQYKTSSNFKGDRDSNLSDSEVIKIMQKLAKERRETADVYKNAGRTELAEKELAEANIIDNYLPKAMTESEVEEMVKTVIAEVGATSMKEMGLVIKNVNAKANGRTDGKTISTIVKRLLS